MYEVLKKNVVFGNETSNFQDTTQNTVQTSYLEVLFMLIFISPVYKGRSEEHAKQRG
jgi:hypothetical protein